ncbi:hypothetical protein [Bifidobacterium miconis]|nr:hypothetical protein [Bifidobacterium miconis]
MRKNSLSIVELISMDREISLSIVELPAGAPADGFVPGYSRS